MWHIETIFFTIILIPIAALVMLHLVVAIHGILTQPPWQSVTGVLEEAALQHDDDFQPFISVRYKFHINDQPYWGNQTIRVGKAVARSEIRKLCPIGHRIGVDYHPFDPENQSRLKESDRKRISSA